MMSMQYIFLGNTISKYWIYQRVHISNLQACCFSTDNTQTISSQEQASSSIF